MAAGVRRHGIVQSASALTTTVDRSVKRVRIHLHTTPSACVSYVNAADELNVIIIFVAATTDIKMHLNNQKFKTVVIESTSHQC